MNNLEGGRVKGPIKELLIFLILAKVVINVCRPNGLNLLDISSMDERN